MRDTRRATPSKSALGDLLAPKKPKRGQNPRRNPDRHPTVLLMAKIAPIHPGARMRFNSRAKLDPSQIRDLRALTSSRRKPGGQLAYESPAAYNRGHSGRAKTLDPGNYGTEGPYWPAASRRKKKR